MSSHENVLFPALQVIAGRQNMVTRMLHGDAVRRMIAQQPHDINTLLDTYLTGDYEADRFVSLNLLNLREGGLGTVEFRLFNGTLSPEMIGCYVGLALGMSRYALQQNAFPQAVPPPGTTTISGLLETLEVASDNPLQLLLTHQWEQAVNAKIPPALRGTIGPWAQPHSQVFLTLLVQGVSWARLQDIAARAPDDYLSIAGHALDLFTISTASLYREAVIQHLCALAAPDRDAFVDKARPMLHESAFRGRVPEMMQLLASVPRTELAAWCDRWQGWPPGLLTAHSPRQLEQIAATLAAAGIDLAQEDELSSYLSCMEPSALRLLMATLAPVLRSDMLCSEGAVFVLSRFWSLEAETLQRLGHFLVATCRHFAPENRPFDNQEALALNDMMVACVKLDDLQTVRVMQRLKAFYRDGHFDTQVGEVTHALARASARTLDLLQMAPSLWEPPMTGRTRSELLLAYLQLPAKRLMVALESMAFAAPLQNGEVLYLLATALQSVKSRNIPKFVDQVRRDYDFDHNVDGFIRDFARAQGISLDEMGFDGWDQVEVL